MATSQCAGSGMSVPDNPMVNAAVREQKAFPDLEKCIAFAEVKSITPGRGNTSIEHLLALLGFVVRGFGYLAALPVGLILFVLFFFLGILPRMLIELIWGPLPPHSPCDRMTRKRRGTEAASKGRPRGVEASPSDTSPVESDADVSPLLLAANDDDAVTNLKSSRSKPRSRKTNQIHRLWLIVHSTLSIWLAPVDNFLGRLLTAFLNRNRGNDDLGIDVEMQDLGTVATSAIPELSLEDGKPDADILTVDQRSFDTCSGEKGISSGLLLPQHCRGAISDKSELLKRASTWETLSKAAPKGAVGHLRSGNARG